MPPPSSSTSTTMLPESWYAASRTTPRAGLPCATRTSGDSMPWSRELRTRCINGSAMCSTSALSTSVSPPVTSRATFFPRAVLTSRTTRWKRLNVVPIGTMRRRSASSRTPSISRIVSLMELRRLSSPLNVAASPAPAPAISNSPTVSIRRSRRLASTRMVDVSAGLRSEARCAGWASAERERTSSLCGLGPLGHRVLAVGSAGDLDVRVVLLVCRRTARCAWTWRVPPPGPCRRRPVSRRFRAEPPTGMT